MAIQPIRIAQLSDIHLFLDHHKELLGVKTRESFQAVFDLIKQGEEKLDLIILSGDLSQDETAESYQHLADMIGSLNVPVYFIPGNHDNAEVMNQSLKHHNIQAAKHILINNWQIILLNSQKPGAVEGYLDDSQLDFLKMCLVNHPEHQAIVVFHHQPLPVGCSWLDNIGLINADAFWQIVDKHHNMHTILFGHVHQAHETSRKNIQCYSAPSTCFQFKTNSPGFALQELPPGYRIIELFEDAVLKTQVKRVAKYVGYFDNDAKGY